MVSRREKIRRQVYRLKEEIFHKQTALLDEDSSILTHTGTREYKSITTAHKMPAEDSIYDQYDGILTTARILDGPYLDVQAEGMRAERPRGPGRPARMLEGRSKGKGIKGKGKMGKESVAKKAEEGGKAQVAVVVKKEVEEPETEEHVDVEQNEEEPVEEEEAPVVTRGLRSRVVSSPIPRPRSPYQHPGAKSPSQGSKSPQQESRLPHPGAKSPAHGSSAPATLPEPRRGKGHVSKNLFKEVHVPQQREAEEERSLRSRTVRSPQPTISIVDSDSESESIPVKRELRSRTVVTPVVGTESSNETCSLKDEVGAKSLSSAPQHMGGKEKGKSAIVERTGAVDTPGGGKDSGARPKRRPGRPRAHASPTSNPEGTTSDENVCEVTAPQKDLRSRTKSVAETVSATALERAPFPLPSTTAIETTAIKTEVKIEPGIFTEDLRLKERQQNIRVSPQRLVAGRGGRTRRRTTSTQSMEKKSILNGILASTSLIVSQDIRNKVQQKLRRNSTRWPYPNGICPHTQKKIDDYYGQQGRSDGGNRIRSPASLPNSETSRGRRNMVHSSWSASDIAKPQHLSQAQSPHRSSSWQTGQGRLTPDTRRSRRRIESDLESEATSDKCSESMDGDINVKSSRETTPDPDTLARRPSSRRGLNFGGGALGKRLAHRLAEGSSHGSQDSSPYVEVNSDSDYAPSEPDSEDSSAYRTRRTRQRISRNVEGFDEASRDSITSSSSGNKYSTRSKLNDSVNQVVGYPR